MADKPNDRVPDVAPKGDEPEPRVYLVVGGEKFARPSLETYYAQGQGSAKKTVNQGCSCNTVAGSYCQCNKVCTCNLVNTCQPYMACPCQSFAACSCQGYTANACPANPCIPYARQLRTSCDCVAYVRPPHYRGGSGSYCYCIPVRTCICLAIPY